MKDRRGVRPVLPDALARPLEDPTNLGLIRGVPMLGRRVMTKKYVKPLGGCIGHVLSVQPDDMLLVELNSGREVLWHRSWIDELTDDAQSMEIRRRRAAIRARENREAREAYEMTVEETTRREELEGD